MNIRDLIPQLGVLQTPYLMRAPLARAGNGVGFQIVEDNYALIHQPPYDQRQLGCCESAGTCRALELLWYRQSGQAVSLNFVKAYRATVARFYPNRPANQEGLGLGDTARLAIELGVLPEGTFLRAVPLHVGGICAALARGPIILGSFVHEGWSEEHLSPAGDLDETYGTGRMGLQAIMAGRGHCTLGISADVDGDAQYMGSENSWGWWGHQSLYFQSFPHFIAMAMQEPVEIVLPASGMEGAKLELWQA